MGPSKRLANRRWSISQDIGRIALFHALANARFFGVIDFDPPVGPLADRLHNRIEIAALFGELIFDPHRGFGIDRSCDDFLVLELFEPLRKQAIA